MSAIKGDLFRVSSNADGRVSKLARRLLAQSRRLEALAPFVGSVVGIASETRVKK
jgi:hypothetical protein